MVSMVLKIFMLAFQLLSEKNGVEKIIELTLANEEKNNFTKSVESVRGLFDAASKIDSSLLS